MAGDNSADGGYSLHLTDLSMQQVELIMASLGQMSVLAIQSNHPEDAVALGEVQDQIFSNNQDLVREILIESDRIRASSIPNEIIDELDVEIKPDGTVVEAEDYTEIDIE